LIAFLPSLVHCSQFPRAFYNRATVSARQSCWGLQLRRADLWRIPLETRNPAWEAGRGSLAYLDDQRRVNVTAQITIIASMHMGMRKPIIFSSHRLCFSSHHLRRKMAFFFDSFMAVAASAKILRLSNSCSIPRGHSANSTNALK
jgi:hypothetical protein